jgi:hypothetical protein
MSNSFNGFLNNIESLQEEMYSLCGVRIFDVANYFLTDDEVVEKLLEQKNPSLSRRDIKRISRAVRDNLGNDDSNDDITIDENDSRRDREEKRRRQREKRRGDEGKKRKERRRLDEEDEEDDSENLTEEERRRRRERRRRERRERGLDVEEEESEEGLSEEEKRVKRERKRRERRERRKKFDEEDLNDELDEDEGLDEGLNETEREERRQRREKRRRDLRRIYLERWNSIKIEARKLKSTIRSAIYVFINKIKDIAQLISTTFIKTAITIPALILESLALPFNIPLALNNVLLVIDSILNLVSQFKSILPLLEPMKDINLVVDNEDLGIVTNKLNILIKTLGSLSEPICIIIKFILIILGALKVFFKKGASKIFKRATKRLIKLGHIQKSRGNKDRGEPFTQVDDEIIKLSDGSNPNIHAYDEDDISEIVSLLDQFEITKTKKWGGEWHVSGYKKQENDSELGTIDLNNIDLVIDELEKKIEESNGITSSKEIDMSEFSQFIYDITLEDGTVIPSITEEGLEYFRRKYILIIEN